MILFYKIYLYWNALYIFYPSSLCSDLARNYLNGTIPGEWGAMQLTKMWVLLSFCDYIVDFVVHVVN